jgi:hypothetical protein
MADGALFGVIEKICNNLGQFRGKGFFPGDVSQHFDNIPSEYQITAPMISVKCRYEVGNVQFTMARARHAAGDAVLLDCDMDEHSNVLVHLTDVFKHVFTGGTHPVDIHEYIVHHKPEIQLGYTLEPAQTAQVPLLDGAAAGGP